MIIQGLVLYGSNNIYAVLDDAGNHWSCRIKGKRLRDIPVSHNPIAPGDRVTFQQTNHQEGQIEERLQRHSSLQRLSKRNQTQVLAANLDQAWIVCSWQDPLPQMEQLSRLILLAKSAKLPTTIILNKTDLLAEGIEGYQPQRELRQFRQLARQTLAVATIDPGEKPEWEMLKQSCQNKTTAIIGVSGVGKSSLINRLLNCQIQQTASISPKWRRGTHTTTRATMIVNGNSRFIDTPGIRSVIPIIKQVELADYFDEFLPHRYFCRFSGCSHQHEPECGVRQAVRFGAISTVRHRCYCRIYQSLAEKY